MEEGRLPPLSSSPTLRSLLIRFWTIVAAACAISFLIGLAVPINERERHPDPPLWPESVIYDQEIIEEASYNIADLSTIFYHWPSKSWWANHTNLFNSHCHADLLWVRR